MWSKKSKSANVRFGLSELITLKLLLSTWLLHSSGISLITCVRFTKNNAECGLRNQKAQMCVLDCLSCER